MTSPNPQNIGLSTWQIAFIGAIVAIGLGFVGYAGFSYINPPPPAPKVHLADAAMKLVRSYKGEPLSEPLEKMLLDTKHHFFDSEPHPLLNKKAPQFSLNDVDGHTQDLEALLKRGPVVIVFYYGYHCDHCVSQLFDMNEDIKYFNELGAQVVAISADPVDTTLANYKDYGRFNFLVLSDPDNKVAEQFGTYNKAAPREEARLQHGTFIISRDGVIRWAKRGDDPFRDNRTLLYHLAKAESRLPSPRQPISSHQTQSP